MTLPRRSTAGDLVRQIVRRLCINLSVVLEPLRSRLRDRALQRRMAEVTRARTSESAPSPLLFLLVYRAKNAALVELLLRECHLDADVRLWALDEIAPSLAHRTLGCGAGTRFANLNALYFSKPVHEGSWVVVADDDAFFTKGGLDESISIMKRACFSFAQPSHSVLGWWTTLFNVSRPFMVARDANYVEQGPLFIADDRFAKIMLPFPEENDMGWGIEAEWYQAKGSDFRSGVIDRCRVVHCGRAASAYATDPEMLGMENRLSRLGVDSFWQLLSVNARWWTWQSAPAWTR